MTATSPQQRVSGFWSSDHWRNGYKATSPNAHSGLDIGGHRAGMTIPAIRKGVVTHSFFDAYYGWVLAVQVSSSTWHLYCHMLTRSHQPIGAEIEFGEGVGQVGASGAYAVGFHLHLTVSSSWKPAHRPTTNPKATVNAALKKATAPAGGGTVIPIPAEKAKNMSTIYYATDDNKAAHSGNKITMYALAGESPGTSANWLETTSSSIKDSWSGGHGPGVFLTAASFASFKARHLEPLRIEMVGAAVTSDAAVLRALEELKSIVPTAAENGAASRAAIVKAG